MPLDDITPIRSQYLQIKKQYSDAILFFRLGDFYETFDHDAEITSRELDIVLTSRAVAKGKRVPMAGIPYHAVENYLARLIDRGYHVAICEQVGEQPAKGLFPRQVVRVVTPGTLLEPTLLDGSRHNYLVSIIYDERHAGLAYTDISTGGFFCAEFHEGDIHAQLRTELSRLNPSEILLPDTAADFNNYQGHLTRWPVWNFEIGRCTQILLQHFGTVTLDGFGLREKSIAISAAGALIQYLEETQPSALPLLTSLSTYSLDEFMTLDTATRRNLELTETIRNGDAQGSLLSIIDHTVSPMGKRLIREWISKPLLNIPAIQARQQGVTFFIGDGLLRAEFFDALKSIIDIERVTNRIFSGHATPRELSALRSTLQRLPSIKEIFSRNTPENRIGSNLDACDEVRALLEKAISDEPPATLQNVGVIQPGFSTELDQIVEASRNAREWIANLESTERERTGIKTLKVGFNKVFGYYIEITHSNTNHAPADYIRKQTLVNAERYITPEMKEYEALVLNAEERIHEVESRLFKEICEEIGKSSALLLQTAAMIAELDVLASLAELAVIGSYNCPEIVEESILEIHDGRHPVVERKLIAERFVPNDAIFENDEIVRLITGPNMSGKSTFLRQVALIVLLAQIGSYVPVSSARIGLVDRIFTRIGAQDEIFSGQSTFMVEMTETANILNNATVRSLLILDEIGRGTSTYDGLSIAWSVIEFIHNHPKLRARTLFATHYHELTQLSELLPGVRNYNVAVTEAEGHVVFLHKIVPGGTDRSYGIHVGQLAGLPAPVIQRASEILKQLENSSGKAIHLEDGLSQQMTLFPETNPLLDELGGLDLNTISPIEALNKLHEWQRNFINKKN
jgi:DNA mismatch repair protein MutS